LAEVYHLDLYGKRDYKYKYLLKSKFSKVKFTKLKPSAPEYFFVPKDYSAKGEYEKGFSVEKLFTTNSVGIVTAKDSIFVNSDKKTLLKNIKERFNINPDNKLIQSINYRPFDRQYVYYDVEKIERAREKVMSHFLMGENVGLIFKRGFTENASPIFISNCIIEFRSWSRPGMQGGDYICPLYLYLDRKTRQPNLNAEIVAELSQRIGLQYVEEKEVGSYRKTFAPIDVLDYIYAVLHSPAYRKKYKEFLKIDFPRVPYPESAEQFRTLAKFGEKLRRLHLLEGVEPQKGTADYPVPGNDEVEKIIYEAGKVFINKKQYFENVPQEAWEFYIGGYQPAQKWLKDRKGRVLSYDETLHYRKIIQVLAETARIMGEIDF